MFVYWFLLQDNTTFMRDTKRIKPLLEEIEKLWINNPDFRFGQLVMSITNTGEHNPKLYNMEEEAFLEKLKELETKLNNK